MSQAEERRRMLWLDIAKGIAIILMIIGHAPGIPGYARGVIFSFHMPLFIVINGYLIKNYDIRGNLAGSGRTLLKPYIIICLIQAVFCMYSAPDIDGAGIRLFSGFNDMVLGLSRTSTILTDYGSVWLVWFVICLFFSRNLYVVIMSLSQRLPVIMRYLIIISVCLSGYLIGTKAAFLPWSLDVAMVSVVFIAVGDEIRRKNLMETGSPLLPMLSLVIWAAFLYGRTYIELATRSYPLVFGCIIEAVAGSVFCLFICRIIEKKGTFISGILCWYGRHSLLILALHCIEMRFLNIRDTIIKPLGSGENWMIISLFRIILISAAAMICSKLNEFFVSREREHFSCTEESSDSSRLSWPDVSKGICIICVIAGHMGVGFINRLVFLWHLPVFFLISGYFLKKDRDSVIIANKAKRLLIPYYLTCAVICMISAIRAVLGGKDPLRNVLSWIGASLYAAGGNWSRPFEIKGIGAIWFLWALFFAFVITNHFIGSDILRSFIIISIIAFAGWGSIEWTGFWLPLSIQAGMLASLYLIIGYSLREKGISPSGIPVAVLMASGLAAALGIQKFKGFWLVHDHMGNGWIDFFISLCASLVIMVFAEHICKTSPAVKEVLTFFGRNSLLILCLHIVELNVLPIKSALSKVLSHLSFSCSDIIFITLVFSVKLVYVVIGTLILMRSTRVRSVFG